MKKLILGAILLAAVFASKTANAQAGAKTEGTGDITCFNQIQYALGWAGYDFYYGSACYSYFGIGPQVSFTPYFPVG